MLIVERINTLSQSDEDYTLLYISVPMVCLKTGLDVKMFFVLVLKLLSLMLEK